MLTQTLGKLSVHRGVKVLCTGKTYEGIQLFDMSKLPLL